MARRDRTKGMVPERDRAGALTDLSDEVVIQAPERSKRQKWHRDTPRKMMESGKIEGGGMAERLNAPVLKTVRVERLSGVRIPLPPPTSTQPRWQCVPIVLGPRTVSVIINPETKC